MNIGFYACLVLAIIFGILTIVFFLSKEKGAMLISGFNTLFKHEQELYDIEKMRKTKEIQCLFGRSLCVLEHYFHISYHNTLRL